MDGIEKLKGVTIIAATNRPDCIDAVCRNNYNSNIISEDILIRFFIGIDATRTF